MSNRYNGTIITIDTTDTQIGGSGPAGSAVAGAPHGSLHIRAMQWLSCSESNRDIANDDDLIIKYKDKDGDICISTRAAVNETAALQDGPDTMGWGITFGGSPWIVDGLYVEDLDGGILVIYLD